MSRRNVRDRALILILAALIGAAPSPGCGTGDGEGAPCATAAECDDGSPCTADACVGDHCVQTPLPDGPGALPQTVNDCSRKECKDGALVSVDDPADLASDDDDCTIDSCINGVSSHLPGPDGVPCHPPSGPGTCLAGVCTGPICGPFASCEDGNPCTADACNPGGTACVSVPLDGIPTPAKPQFTGDCAQSRCVNGVDTDVPDAADVPDDGNPCTADLCKNGEPSHPYLPAGTLCGGGLACDGAGHCGA